MGRASLILIATVALSLAIYGLSIRSRNNEAVQNSATFYSKVRARNISMSAGEIYYKHVLDSASLRGTFPIASILNGSASVTVSQPGASPDTLLVRSIGTFQSVNDTVQYTVTRSSGLPINGAFNVSQNTQATITIPAASTTIDGRNYNSVSGALDNSYPSKDAFSVPAPSKAVFTNWGGNFQLNGKTGAGAGMRDTANFGSAQPNYDPLATSLIPLATQVITSNVSSPITIGTHAAPQITYVHATSSDVGLNQTVTGEGVLILHSNSKTISISNGLNFKGLVIIIGDNSGSSQVNLTNGPNFFGAVLLTGPKITYNNPGGGPFRYSYDAIKSVCTALNIHFGQNANFAVTDWWE
jgi:hypothetical protein